MIYLKGAKNLSLVYEFAPVGENFVTFSYFSVLHLTEESHGAHEGSQNGAIDRCALLAVSPLSTQIVTNRSGWL